MKRVIILSVITGSLLSCMDIHPLSPPKELTPQLGLVTACQASSIEKNIIGTWHFESTYNPNNAVTSGVITFNAQGGIIDPDSLFENYLDVGFVTTKTYKPRVVGKYANYTGEIFEVHLDTKRGAQITPFVLVINECNKIVLGLKGSDNLRLRFTLTK
jgi:hypothetical protein